VHYDDTYFLSFVNLAYDKEKDLYRLFPEKTSGARSSRRRKKTKRTRTWQLDGEFWHLLTVDDAGMAHCIVDATRAKSPLPTNRRAPPSLPRFVLL